MSSTNGNKNTGRDFKAQATTAARQGKDKAAQLAHDNRGKIAGWVEKAGAAADRRTKGKYTSQIHKAKAQVNRGVAKLADQRPDPRGPGAA